MTGRISGSILQGNLAIRKLRNRSRLKNQLIRFAGKAMCGLVLTFIAWCVLFSLAGCAASPLAIKGSIVELQMSKSIKGIVRIGQMGNDCASASEELKKAIADQFIYSDLPAPKSVKVVMLSGSSYCGFSQGTESVITMLELGARNTAVAEVTIYWSGITLSQLQKAHTILLAMRPTTPTPSH